MLDKLYVVDLNEWGFSTILELLLHSPCTMWYWPHLIDPRQHELEFFLWDRLVRSWELEIGMVTLCLPTEYCQASVCPPNLSKPWPSYLSVHSEHELRHIPTSIQLCKNLYPLKIWENSDFFSYLYSDRHGCAIAEHISLKYGRSPRGLLQVQLRVTAWYKELLTVCVWYRGKLLDSACCGMKGLSRYLLRQILEKT